ncbi:MAG: polymer-forming cytoskeletal protein [Oligoflexia bacterium]|nr:polymer-forming cytoskeletal protein [Oligoflexia bacterium]
MNILDRLTIEDIDNEMDVISSNSHFIGSFIFGKFARIDGKLDGSIQSYGVLLVGEQATITADIKGETVVINGILNGNIEAQNTVIIDSKGIVTGDIYTPAIIINNGGKINGQISMSDFHHQLSTLTASA